MTESEAKELIRCYNNNGRMSLIPCARKLGIVLNGYPTKGGALIWPNAWGYLIMENEVLRKETIDSQDPVVVYYLDSIKIPDNGIEVKKKKRRR